MRVSTGLTGKRIIGIRTSKSLPLACSPVYVMLSGVNVLERARGSIPGVAGDGKVGLKTEFSGDGRHDLSAVAVTSECGTVEERLSVYL